MVMVILRLKTKKKKRKNSIRNLRRRNPFPGRSVLGSGQISRREGSSERSDEGRAGWWHGFIWENGEVPTSRRQRGEGSPVEAGFYVP